MFPEPGSGFPDEYKSFESIHLIMNKRWDVDVLANGPADTDLSVYVDHPLP